MSNPKPDAPPMRTMTLSIDVPRHDKLKRTAELTKLSMSELTRIALDRLWAQLGDLDRITPRQLLVLFADTYPDPDEVNKLGMQVLVGHLPEALDPPAPVTDAEREAILKQAKEDAARRAGKSKQGGTKERAKVKA